MKYTFELKGISDLKMDKFVDDIQPTTEAGYIKQAEKKVYTDDDGNLAIEARAVKASIIAAAMSLSGRKQKDVRQTFMASLFVNPDNLTILPERKKHDGIDRLMVSRKSGTKVTRVPSFRPLVKKGWAVKGEISVLSMQDIATDFLKQSFELAGLKFGLLGHRPEYGRFEVTKFEEVK